MTDESIREYILASEQNVGIAAAVSQAWPEARDQLVSAFLSRLEVKLAEKLQGWKYGHENSFFVHQYPNFSFCKPAWENQYWIVLECHDYGRKMIFGVTRNEEQLKNRPFNEKLLDAMKTLDPSASARKWWEAQMTMRSPAADWRTPEVLWRIHKDETFLADVAEQLLAVAKVSEKIVDQMARKR